MAQGASSTRQGKQIPDIRDIRISGISGYPGYPDIRDIPDIRISRISGISGYPGYPGYPDIRDIRISRISGYPGYPEFACLALLRKPLGPSLGFRKPPVEHSGLMTEPVQGQASPGRGKVAFRLGKTPVWNNLSNPPDPVQSSGSSGSAGSGVVDCGSDPP